MKPLKQSNESWIVEFDRLFADTQFGPSNHIHYFNEAGIYPKVKDFIQSEIDKARSEERSTFITRLRRIIPDIPITKGLADGMKIRNKLNALISELSITKSK